MLVHCQAGISRSASVVIGYCMWKDKVSAEAATAAVQRARGCIWPNAGFKCQLREFEAMHCDASRWTGWSMQKYLHTQYGDDSVGFMSSMLGGPPVDRLRGPNGREARARASSATTAALAACSPRARAEVSKPGLEHSSSFNGEGSSGYGAQPVTSITASGSAGNRRRAWSSTGGRSLPVGTYSAAAAAGVTVMSSSLNASISRPRVHQGMGEDAALRMAG